MNQPTLFCHPMNSLGKDIILKLRRTKKKKIKPNKPPNKKKGEYLETPQGIQV